MAFWAACRLEPHRENLALHCLGLAGFVTYLPRIRERRVSHGRKIKVRQPLFPGYCFFVVEAQWHAARWSVGVLGLIMDGLRPAKVPDNVIAEIRSREVGGLIELAPPPSLRRGARVRILAGPFRDRGGDERPVAVVDPRGCEHAARRHQLVPGRKYRHPGLAHHLDLDEAQAASMPISRDEIGVYRRNTTSPRAMSEPA